MLPALLLLLACVPDPNAPPPRPEGVLEVLEVETSGGVVNSSDMVIGRNQGCIWGREIWQFDGKKVLVQNDVLCRGQRPDETYGCQVRAYADAIWDPERGVFNVPKRVGARGQFIGTKDSNIDPGLRIACSVTVAAGEYPVARVRNGKWKWEMRTPAGMVLRFARSDIKVDFGFAMAEAAKADGGKQ